MHGERHGDSLGIRVTAVSTSDECCGGGGGDGEGEGSGRWVIIAGPLCNPRSRQVGLRAALQTNGLARMHSPPAAPLSSTERKHTEDMASDPETMRLAPASPGRILAGEEGGDWREKQPSGSIPLPPRLRGDPFHRDTPTRTERLARRTPALGVRPCVLVSARWCFLVG